MSPWYVLDDFFPNLLTGFRVAEYNHLLAHFPQLRIASSYGEFDRAHREYAAIHPVHAQRVQPLVPGLLAGCPLVYLNFLNNAHGWLPLLHEHRVPFVMTLYPGGGFGLYEAASDAKLARVLASPWLREVIVTQDVTRDYLAARAPADLPITEIFGVVADAGYFQSQPARGWHGEGKPMLDIAFVAEKYMPEGANKGFPAFVSGVARLRQRLPADDFARIRFHVVGGFEPQDWTALAPGAQDARAWPLPVRFHGRLETSRLRALLQDIDVVVSPNLPGLLHPGNFDGFPTGCCVEAALCGAAFVATDTLSLSQGRFVDGEHFLRLEPGGESVAQALLTLVREPARIGALARAGCARARELFDPAVQLGRRLAVLERQLARAQGLEVAA